MTWEDTLESAKEPNWADTLSNAATLIAEPNTFTDLIPSEELPGPVFRTTPEDIRDIEKRTKDVLGFADKYELPVKDAEENYDEINKQITEFDPNLFDGLGVLDELEKPKEKPSLLKRIGMSLLRKTFIEPLIAIETKSRAMSGMGIMLETITLTKEFTAETGREPTSEEFNELAKLGKAIYVNSVYRKYSFLNVAPPKTLAEKAAELGTGLTSFLTQLAIAKKILGPGGVGRDVMAWEMVNMAEGGPAGKGAVMRLAFAGINKVPAKTLVGKTLKTGAAGTTLASAAAISGGSREDVAVAFLIPFALRAISATSAKAAKLTRGALEKRTIKQMRTFVGDKGYDLSKVPDDALREIINVAKRGNWWSKQYKKGKINEATLDKRLGQLQDRIKPIIVAIAKQQPEKDVMAKYQKRIADRIQRGGPTQAVDVRAMIAQAQAELDQALSGKAPPTIPVEIPKLPPEPPAEAITPEKAATVVAKPTIEKPEEIAKRLGVPIKVVPKGLRAKAQYRKRTDDIAIRSHLPKGFDKDAAIAHELGHRAHTKISNDDMDAFNKLVEEFRQEVNKNAGRNITYFEEKGDYHGYFEAFAELYGRYIRGQELPNNQFKKYFDEVAPLAPPTPAEAITPEKPPTVPTKAETIEAPVVVVSGKVFEGKTHGEAVQKAIDAGLAFRNEEGRLEDTEGNLLAFTGATDLFRTSTGRIVNRFEADRIAGITSAEALAEAKKVAPTPTEATAEVTLTYPKAKEEITLLKGKKVLRQNPEYTKETAEYEPAQIKIEDFGNGLGLKGRDVIQTKSLQVLTSGMTIKEARQLATGMSKLPINWKQDYKIIEKEFKAWAKKQFGETYREFDIVEYFTKEPEIDVPEIFEPRAFLTKMPAIRKQLSTFSRIYPEFTKNPVFTVELEKGDPILVYRGYAYKVRYWPSVFGIRPDFLKEGQKIRIDLASFDIKPASKAALEKAKPFYLAPGELPSEQISKAKPIDIDHRDAGFVEIPPVTTAGKIEAEHPNIRIVAPKKDISAIQKWVLTSTNQAQNTGHPTIIKAANTMADIGMVMQNEIRSQLAADGEVYKQLPKEYRIDKGRKFFELMDKHYSPEEIDIAKDVPDEVKPVLKHFKLQDEAMRQEIIKQKRTMMKAIFQRKSLPELQKLATEKDIQITKPGATKTINRTKAELARDLAVEEIGDDWGRQWSHIQHIFFGRYELQFIDLEGNPHFIGKAQTQTEAYEKLADWKAARTAAGFDDADKVKLIATPELHIPFDVMRISRKHFYTLENQIQEAANLQRDEIQDALRGIVGKKESKQKWWGSLMHRKGAPGYSQDFMRVWMVQTAQFNRWKHLSEMNRKVTPLIDQIRSEGLRGWAQYLEDTKDFLWGKKRGDIGRELDVFLSKIPVVKNYIKPFAFERWAGLIKSINYWRHLQTGRFYAVNTMQLAQTLWPVVGEKGLYRGISLYYSKEGQALLRKYKIAGTSGKLHEIGMKRTRRFERYTPAGASELRNQGVAFLALYDDGIKRGMSESEAASYARLRGQLFTQFSYTPSDIPKMMRGPIGGLIFQYKRFTIKNLELVSRMAREGKWGGVARWLAALVSIGGLSTFLKVLPTGLAGYLTYSMYKKVKDEYGKETADVIHHGLPGLVDVDLSGSVTPIDVPYGRNIYEKAGNIVFGPTGQTAVRLMTDIRELKVAKEIGLVPRGLKSIVDSSPTVKQFVYLAKALEKDTTNYDAKQRMMYELEVWDLWKKAFGFRAESETLQRMQFEAMMDLKVEYDETIDHIILETMEGNYEQAIKHISDWQGKYPEAPISANSVVRRLKERGMARTLPMTDRAFKELPAPLKNIFAGEKKAIKE